MRWSSLLIGSVLAGTDAGAGVSIRTRVDNNVGENGNGGNNNDSKLLEVAASSEGSPIKQVHNYSLMQLFFFIVSS